jgi:transcriptional regulator with XRE-family HTH domain
MLLGRGKLVMVDLKRLRDGFHYKRWTNKLRLEDVAKEIKVSSSTLSRFEANKNTPQLEQLEAIADWLGMEIILVEKKG